LGQKGTHGIDGSDRMPRLDVQRHRHASCRDISKPDGHGEYENEILRAVS
jgi:hypothetical protein